MNEWKEKSLDELVEVDPEYLTSSTESEYSFFYIDISSVSLGNINYPIHPIIFKESPSRARKILKEYDILMSTVRPNLKAFAQFKKKSNLNFIASTGFAILRAKKNTDVGFIYHSLFSSEMEKQIDALVVGSNYPAINSSDVKKLKINVPSFPLQRHISHILSITDAVIEKTQAAIAKYKAIKQGMLHDLFTRGIDITTGKLRPKCEDAPQLYKESKLGMVPKEWAVEEFHKTCDLITDGSHFSPKPLDIGEIIANVKDMGEFGINYESCTRISSKDFITLKNQNCSPKYGDVLLSKDGTIGRVILFRDKRGIVVLSSIAILRPSIKLKSEFLYVFLKSESFDKQLLVKTSGSALKRIVLRDINNLLITYPVNYQEQNLISDKIIEIENKLNSEQNYLHKLQKLKAGLMGDLLSGRKKVSEPLIEAD